MNIKLISDFPFWFVLLCILLGSLYAILLYFKEKKNEFSAKSRRLLAIIRLLAVTVISFLLMAPMIRNTSSFVEKPIILFAQDNSESILQTKDSSQMQKTYPKTIQKLHAELGGEYNLRTLSFGSEIKDSIDFSFDGKITDIQSMLENISSIYENRNLGAVILASDGIYNKGGNPLYEASNINAPIYTIALGDTSIKKDALIKDIKYNKISYLGNYFPLELIIEGRKIKGQKAKLTIKHKGNELISQNINFTSNSFIKSIPIKLEATESGLQKYNITLSQVEGEVSLTNNYRNIYIDILDSRQKILLLNSVPHPDVSAIKKSIQSNKNYEVESFNISKFEKSIKGYNLVILHGLPSRNHKIDKIITEAENSNTPTLFIVSSETYLPFINNLNKGLQVRRKNKGSNEVKAVYNNDFALFTLNSDYILKIKSFPPLEAPFGNYSNFISTNVLFKQQIGSITSSMPLILFNNDKENKIGFIAAEGLWRWKLADFKYNENHNTFNEIISKIVQYLCVKIDKSLFRVKSKNSFNENESIEFSAELYNESYELINQPEVELTVYNNEKRYPYTFSKTANAYHINIGSFAPGEYSYISKVILGEKEYVEKGIFTVKKINIESINAVANHHLLYSIASKSGGEMLDSDEVSKIPELLANRTDIVSIRYPQKTFTEIISIPYLLGTIILLLSLEWFIRKWKGGY